MESKDNEVATNPEELLLKYRRAQLGIDGNCGFALLGANFQEGEAEFVEIESPSLVEQIVACQTAVVRLRKRLKLQHLNYYFGQSHPYGRL